jgi:GT2 family glycosyltransferase
MSGVKVSVSIVSYNSRKVLQKCINSVIETSKDQDIEIIVVDNCSEDGSAEIVQSSFPNIRLLQNRENVGFGRAHNQSFRVSKGKYFLILNPDTVIFPGTIQKTIQFMENHQRVGVAGCKIFWDDERKFMFPDLRIHDLKTGIIHFTPFFRYFPKSTLSRWYEETAHRLWNASAPVKVDGVTGGLMFVRREAFESAGLFDESFFLFFEEHDLLRRIKEEGWEIYYLPDAAIQHYFEESFRNSSLDIAAIYKQSALNYYRKHYGIPGYLYITCLFMLNRLLHSVESRFNRTRSTYAEVAPVNDRLIIEWPSSENVNRYLVEISYAPSFFDRAGMYVKSEQLSIKRDILDRLPHRTGFLRIRPVYDDASVGAEIRVFKLRDHPGLPT